jgi:hypothetical protein
MSRCDIDTVVMYPFFVPCLVFGSLLNAHVNVKFVSGEKERDAKGSSSMSYDTRYIANDKITQES